MLSWQRPGTYLAMDAVQPDECCSRRLAAGLHSRICAVTRARLTQQACQGMRLRKLASNVQGRQCPAATAPLLDVRRLSPEQSLGMSYSPARPPHPT